jgi:predicted transcriptional regulator
MQSDQDSPDLVELTAQIVATFVERNSVEREGLAPLIASVHSALLAIASPPAAEPEVKMTPAQIRKTITPDHLVSLEDGRPYKALRRHLSTRGMTPDDYRRKWGLPADYPMVAPNYSAQRSAMAHRLGLGRKGAAARAENRAAAASESAAPARRGRKPKAGGDEAAPARRGRRAAAS